MENIQAVISQQAGKITCNFEQVEAALNERMHEFDGAIFTEESKSIAKKIVAGLRAEQKGFADNLKEEKKKYMAPWDSFEARAKLLIAKYDEPVNYINGQVKEMEEKRVAEKRKQISQIYLESIDGTNIDNYITLERIYNPKWENATYKEKDIRKDIVSAAVAVSQAVTTIQMMNSEAQDKAIEVYKKILILQKRLLISTGTSSKSVTLLPEKKKNAALKKKRVSVEKNGKSWKPNRGHVQQLRKSGARQKKHWKLSAAEQRQNVMLP